MSGGAAIYSITDEPTARAEAQAWARFTGAADHHQLLASWLGLLASRVARARAALLLVSEGESGTFSVEAAWPDPQRDLQYLGPVAQRALTERQGIVAGTDGGAHVGYPVEIAGRLCAAVVLDIGTIAPAELQTALREIHWASAWLVDHFRQAQLRERDLELAHVADLNDIMATALQHRKLQASALAVANALASRLQCDRVAVGFEAHGQMVPLVLSHMASFDRRSDLARAITESMDEVLDLGVPIVFPPPSDDELGAMAHAAAAQALGSVSMVSVPLQHEAETLGVITLERTAGPAFDAAQQRLARAVGIMLGPVWARQRAAERPWVSRAREATRSGMRALLGPQYPGAKLIGGLVLICALVLSQTTTAYRVSARTVIEGATQLALVAPFDGFIAQSFARAGDTVRSGQALARLDDRDLTLERARWSAEREQLRRRLQVAMAQGDRAAMGVLAAQVAQAEAQMSLANEKRLRATLAAPFDGVVVSGDLSRSLGTPVEQGKLLFEIAPLDGFRVVLQVDDRDIAQLAIGQAGELVLSSLPDQAVPFAVSSITPVASQQDGRNVFRVEAQVAGSLARLRPGMEGIGKVVVGERRLLWIWTHGFVDWLRLALWGWLP